MTRAHHFHIPVMGTGFTIDTPLKVARFGIASVVSICDDRLMERLRRHYSEAYRLPYDPIGDRDEDSRARRITAYLDLLSLIVENQRVAMLKDGFSAGSELHRYFELLDGAHPLKAEHARLSRLPYGRERDELLRRLAESVAPGAIDVNIMTKVDAPRFGTGEQTDALSALRGFARSRLRSSVEFSAGLNLSLYSYLGRFDDFFPSASGDAPVKKVALKVSDFRSALVQAKVLAKRGIWVSEYRVESGLNCGGHAFATTGRLMGPVLEEFRARHEELIATVFPPYRIALKEKRGLEASAPPPYTLTAQGGVGTPAEAGFLLERYGLASVGWGTPFLLVPDATSVDEGTLRKLLAAEEGDVYLSDASPLGVPFYNLRQSDSEEQRRRRISEGRPGSSCPNRYLAFNEEFGVRLCTASSAYQKKKLESLRQSGLSGPGLAKAEEEVLAKACICVDLAGGAILKNGVEAPGEKAAPAICPGPNLIYFKKTATLKEMIDHIYGRLDLLAGRERSHVFLNELRLYADYLRDRVTAADGVPYFEEFKENLLEGARYYRRLASETVTAFPERFVTELESLEREIRAHLPVWIAPDPAIP